MLQYLTSPFTTSQPAALPALEMPVADLIQFARSALQKPTGFKAFYGSGLNIKDTETFWANLTSEEKTAVLQLYNCSFGASARTTKDVDDEKFLAMFNALLDTSSNVSHISNAYGQEITAVFHREPLSEADLKAVASSPPDFSELCDIQSGTYWAKDRKQNGYSPLEYLSVVTTIGGKVLAGNKAVLANHSFIVTKEGTLLRQKYGEPNKFVDENGRCH